MIKPLLFLLLFSFTLSCIAPAQKYQLDGFAQGTTYHIAYYSSGGQVVSSAHIDSLLNDFDSSCSLHDSTSLLVALNSNKTDSIDIHIKSCIEAAYMFNEMSNGLYDITVKPLTMLYGFLDKAPQHNKNIDSILNFVGMDKIKVEGYRLIKKLPNVEIDLNSIAQGYSVDLISDFLRSKGLQDFIVELGGEIYAYGDNQGGGWRVGIDRPVDGQYISGNELQAIITIKNQGLTTSGNYRKFYTTAEGERVNHTINPKSGKSSQNSLLSVTVLAQNALLADGYTTAFMLMGLDDTIKYLEQHPNLEVFIVYTENEAIKTYISNSLDERIELKIDK